MPRTPSLSVLSIRHNDLALVAVGGMIDPRIDKAHRPLHFGMLIEDWTPLEDVARKGNGYGKEQIRHAGRPFHGRGESWRHRASRAVCSRLRTPRESNRLSDH